MHNAGDSALPSGELAVAMAEAEALRERGVSAHLHVINNDRVRRLFSFNTLVAGFNIFWSRSSFQSTKELIEKYKPDIVHFHGVLPLLTPSAFHACKKKGVPVVQTLHNFRWVCVEGGLYKDHQYCETCIKSSGWQGVFYGCSRGSRLISFLLWLVNLFYRKSGLLYKWVDRFIAVSEFVRDKYIEAGFPADKIQVKYNAAPALPEDLPFVKASERSGVTFVGRIAPAKGTRIVKEIIRNIELPVNIIGDGPDLPELKHYCQKYNLRHIKFWGKISHEKVFEIVSSSQCVLVPSLFAETFGLVASESMACSTPVVASRIGGLKEIVEQSGCGITVDPNDSSLFIREIYKLCRHPNSITRMGLAGRQYVKERLASKIITDELVSIYQEVIDEKQKRI
jgi:glycosyltransferase involved in cell wall biosynthesis